MDDIDAIFIVENRVIDEFTFLDLYRIYPILITMVLLFFTTSVLLAYFEAGKCFLDSIGFYCCCNGLL